MVIGIFAVVATLLMTVFLCYELIKKQIIEDLRGYAEMLTETAVEDSSSIRGISEGILRITLIAPDGSVLCENAADTSEMENHGSRPEIVKARQTGEGSDIRVSSTLSQNTFYYAVLLENGNVLRVAKEAFSIYRVFFDAIPVLLVIAAVIIVLCAILAHYLTIHLVEPIEKIAENLDDTESGDVYGELVPIFQAIKQNHLQTISNARMRQEFTANVSHELKTPLTAISGYAELIENGMANEADTIRFSGEIRKNANRLLTLINDTIKLSELDEEASVTPLEELDLYEAVMECQENLLINAEKHGIEMKFTGHSCKIHGNKGMLQEIIYNLCDNAIRYNNEGGSVFVSVLEEEGNKILSVRDTGIGIPKEYHERIFERFYRVDKSRSKSTGGTGLGLAIVKHMVARQNAKLELFSDVGKGTEIRVIFSN